MDGSEELKAFVPLLFPLRVVRGNGLFRHEVVNRGAHEGVACAAGARGVVREASRIGLDPLNQLVHGLGRIRNCFGVIREDNGRAAVRLHIIGCDRALSLNGCRIRNLGIIELDEGFLANLRNNLGQVVAAQVDEVIIGIGLVGLGRCRDHIGQRLCARTGQHKLQLSLVLTRIFGVLIEVLGQCFKNGAHIIRAGCPQGHRGLAALRGAGVAAAAATGQHSRHQGACQQHGTETFHFHFSFSFSLSIS